MDRSDPLYGFLPLALAGFATAIALSVHWFVGSFFGRSQSSEQHPSFSKGASQ
jgi:hypothetical protein